MEASTSWTDWPVSGSYGVDFPQSSSGVVRMTTTRTANPTLDLQLEQARQQRTGFYRRLAEAGRRGNHGTGPGPLTTASSVRTTGGFGSSADATGSGGGISGASRRAEISSTAISRRRMHQTDAGGCGDDDVIPSRRELDPLVFTDISNVEAPKPQTSWRYYTSYDNGEWRRHAVPVFKTDDDDNDKKETKEVEEVTVDYDNPGDITNPARRARLSAAERLSRPRGCASLLYTTTTTSGGGNDFRRMETEEPSFPSVVDDPFQDLHCNTSFYSDRLQHNTSANIDDVVSNILGDSWRQKWLSSEKEPEERVLYPTGRKSIFEAVNGAAAEPSPAPEPAGFIEIPEGSKESEFAEKTITPSKKPWVSVPSLSERIHAMALAQVENDVQEFDAEGNVMSESRRAAVVDWLEGANGGPVSVSNHGVEVSSDGQTITASGSLLLNGRQLSSVTKTPSANAADNSRAESSGNSVFKCPPGVDADSVVWIPVVHVPGQPPASDDAGIAAESSRSVTTSKTSSANQRQSSSTVVADDDVQVVPIRSGSSAMSQQQQQQQQPKPYLVRPTAVLASDNDQLRVLHRPSPTTVNLNSSTGDDDEQHGRVGRGFSPVRSKHGGSNTMLSAEIRKPSPGGVADGTTVGTAVHVSSAAPSRTPQNQSRDGRTISESGPGTEGLIRNADNWRFQQQQQQQQHFVPVSASDDDDWIVEKAL